MPHRLVRVMTRARRGSIAAVVVALTALGTTLPAVAPAAAAGGAAPAAPPAAAPAPCNQHAADRPNDEWLTCVGVEAKVSKAPAVGETADLDVTLTSDIDNANAKLRVDLPAGL